jgi:hypothetical protein
MSYSTIYFIGLTVVFAIYYLALMYLDMKAKKEEKSDVETIDVPEPAPDAPPTEVEETDDGYVIRNGKNGTDGSNASSGSQNQGNAAHGDKADNVMSHIQSQFKPVKILSEAEFTHKEMMEIQINGGVTPDGNLIPQTRLRL